MKKLTLDNIEYQYNENDKYEKDGTEYSFVSLKKITEYKGNKKYQNLTIKLDHLDKFKNFLRDILKEPRQSKKQDDEEEIPF